MIEMSRKVEAPNGNHGYHSNPCVVPHPVTLAPVCDTVSMRTGDFHKVSSSHQNMRPFLAPIQEGAGRFEWC